MHKSSCKEVVTMGAGVGRLNNEESELPLLRGSWRSGGSCTVSGEAANLLAGLPPWNLEASVLATLYGGAGKHFAGVRLRCRDKSRRGGPSSGASSSAVWNLIS